MGAVIFAGMITLAKCLEIMHSGEIFSLKVVGYDRRRKDKTGEVYEYPEAKLVWGDGGSDKLRPQGERPMTDVEKMLSAQPVADVVKRNPNHAYWYTRNIRLLVNGQPTAIIKKIHPALIIQFNGETTCP